MLDPVGGINNVKKVTAAIEAAEALVKASTAAQCKMGLVVYGTGAKMLCPQTENYQLLLASIAMIKPDGWTEIGAGLQMCAERLGSASKARSKRIILLTDGLEMLDPFNSRAVHAMPIVDSLLVPNKIVVDCIAFGHEADLELLNSIARKTGGKLVTAYQEIELKKAFLQLETGTRGLLAAENR
jgi:Mg-chelatase subunit ChlD